MQLFAVHLTHQTTTKTHCIMGHIKNQNKFHATINGKRTLCGLSNQHKDAVSIEKFQSYIQDTQWTKLCCEKCNQSTN